MGGHDTSLGDVLLVLLVLGVLSNMVKVRAMVTNMAKVRTIRATNMVLFRAMFTNLVQVRAILRLGLWLQI